MTACDCSRKNNDCRSEQKQFSTGRMVSGLWITDRNLYSRITGTHEFLFTVPLEFR